MSQLQSYRTPLAATVFNALLCLLLLTPAAWTDSDNPTYGPENLLKTLRTPFTTGNGGPDAQLSTELGAFSPIAISSGNVISKKNLLAERFHGPKLFLPTRMVLGECAEFIVQGPPGYYVALAMADKNSGAKPICGHELKLGPDRKLVAVNKIPEQGIVSMSVEAPIQGDLVDAPLYFEAVVWSKPDFSDMQLASAVSTQRETSGENGVLVCGQPSDKKERMVNLGTAEPMSLKTVGSLSSGKP